MIYLVYIASFRERKGFFDKAFLLTEGKDVGRAEIVNDKRGKKKFLKQFSGEAVFSQRYSDDEILGGRLSPIRCSAKELLLPYVPQMLCETVLFAKKSFPLPEAAVFAHGGDGERIVKMLVPFARLISVVGQKKEGKSLDGVPVRYVERLKRAPDAAVVIDECPLPAALRVPTVDISGACEKNGYTLSKETVAFRVPPFLSFMNEEALSCESTAYFIEKGCGFAPELLSVRKKCAPLLTFC